MMICKRLSRTFTTRLLPALALLVLTVTGRTASTIPMVEQEQSGAKYSPLTQVHAGNVDQLEVAWEYHTGDLPPTDAQMMFAFEDRPSLVDGNLVVCTPSRRLVALDPATGNERWVFDPEDRSVFMKKCRGVGHWVDRQAAAETSCRSRIFHTTADNRLLAIDAGTGKLCPQFGVDGVVDMPPSKPELFPGEVMANTDPAVVNDVVVVGSIVGDNQRLDAPSGKVVAFDARSGDKRWEFDPVPRDPAAPAIRTWAQGTEGYGGGNVWSQFAVDDALDLVYLPTTSPSVDFYGADRAGDNLYTTSIVALKGSTGEIAWHFQVVHHNVFDYDLPAQPMLVDIPHDGRLVPALVQNTKQGLVFMFDRATGEPLTPIEERPVPQQVKVPGEVLSPTQPFPAGMPALVPQGFSPDDVWGFTPLDEWLCRRKVEGLNYGPMYTAPSEQGTVFVPALGGGPNWGGGAWDPASHIMVVPSNRVPMVLTMIAKREQDAALRMEDAVAERTGTMQFPNAGAPYTTQVDPLLSFLGAPCSEPPWAALTAIDLVQKKILWEVPLGSIDELAPFPLPWELGAPGAGGPLVTAGGLAFIGYSSDNRFRAFDLKTGKVLWEAELPAAGAGVPVSYEVGGEQYIVIPAGGHSLYNAEVSDAVFAFRLPR